MTKLALNILVYCFLELALFQSVSGQAPMDAAKYPIVAEDGAWCWFSDPRAVYYKGARDGIYFSYINSQGDVMISFRDKSSKVIKTSTLHEKLEIDDHDVASILFLPDGRLLVFYTEHNGRSFMRRSVNREDISSWEKEVNLVFDGTRITYSHPVMLSAENNRIYLFWRGRNPNPAAGQFNDWRQYFSYSDDKGDSWSPAINYIDNKALNNPPYLKVSSDNQSRIDFAFTDGHPGVGPEVSVYHMYFEKGVFYQTNGKKIASIAKLPLPLDQVNKVYDYKKTGIRGWISDISLDRSGKPVIAYMQYPQPSDHRYHYTHWNGRKWIDEEICKSGGWMPESKPGEDQREPYYSGGLALDHHNPSIVYLSRQVKGVFEIERKTLKGHKWQTTPLTVASTVSSMRPYVVNAPGSNPVVLWMAGKYTHYTDFHTAIRSNE